MTEMQEASLNLQRELGAFLAVGEIFNTKLQRGIAVIGEVESLVNTHRELVAHHWPELAKDLDEPTLPQLLRRTTLLLERMATSTNDFRRNWCRLEARVRLAQEPRD